ncbi:MAG: hypothetical protein Q8R78_00965, partial [Candidatus Omnitrophota bacterium]|nr:hypothetical protein [Candidatus Omnitrophota bacterium]
VYEAAIAAFIAQANREGITHAAFGDLFLEDIRQYRERQLARIGMSGIFPLWQRDTQKLAQAFIDAQTAEGRGIYERFYPSAGGTP